MKAKILFFSAITVCIAVFVSCSFDPDISKKPKAEYNDASVRENIALLKASGNFTLDEENLTGWVTMLLNPETDGRGAASGKK